VPRRRLVPYPVRTEADDDRLHHRDLGDLDDLLIWAERCLLTRRLAQIVFHDRDRLISLDWPQREPIPVSEWIRDRLRRLEAEWTRRKRRAA
jgi:hypothetical protein